MYAFIATILALTLLGCGKEGVSKSCNPAGDWSPTPGLATCVDAKPSNWGSDTKPTMTTTTQGPTLWVTQRGR